MAELLPEEAAASSRDSIARGAHVTSDGSRMVPVVRPSFAEFINFNDFVARLESEGAAQVGLVKVVPPITWPWLRDPSTWYTAANNETPAAAAKTAAVDLQALLELNRPTFGNALGPGSRLQAGTVLELPPRRPVPAADAGVLLANAAAAPPHSLADEIPPRLRCLQSLLARCATRPDAAPFLLPVAEQFEPAVAAAYAVAVPHPMDLRTIQRNICSGHYTSGGADDDAALAHARRDLELICLNSETFNPPGSLYTKMAHRLRAWVERELKKQLAKLEKKNKRDSEQAAAMVRDSSPSAVREAAAAAALSPRLLAAEIRPIKQCMSNGHVAGSYTLQIIERKRTTIAAFRALAASEKHKPPPEVAALMHQSQQEEAQEEEEAQDDPEPLGLVVGGIAEAEADATAMAPVERGFWRRLGHTAEPPEYGGDQPDLSVFGTAPGLAGSWDLNCLPTLLRAGLTTGEGGKELPGVTQPMLCKCTLLLVLFSVPHVDYEL